MSSSCMTARKRTRLVVEGFRDCNEYVIRLYISILCPPIMNRASCIAPTSSFVRNSTNLARWTLVSGEMSNYATTLRFLLSIRSYVSYSFAAFIYWSMHSRSFPWNASVCKEFFDAIFDCNWSKTRKFSFQLRTKRLSYLDSRKILFPFLKFNPT